MTDRTAREKLYRSLVRKDRIGLIIGRALAKRKRNWFDRLLVALVMRMAPKGDDFMRDPLTDDAPEFTVEELRRSQSGADKPR
jgi:menaquinone-dependent protoporphyrinogen IX oxidase